MQSKAQLGLVLRLLLWRFLFHLLSVHAEAEQRFLELGVIGSVAVLLEVEHEGSISREGNAILKIILAQKELLRLLKLWLGFCVVGEGLLVVGTELGGKLLPQLDLRSHLARAHGELGDVLQTFTGRDLATRPPAVPNYLKRSRIVAFRLHALKQIILIMPDRNIPNTHPLSTPKSAQFAHIQRENSLHKKYP